MVFTTTVNGIPCQCRVTHFTPHQYAKVNGPPEECYPDEPGEFEFEILDRRGRLAKWLDRYVDSNVADRLSEEYHVMRQGQDYEPYQD